MIDCWLIRICRPIDSDHFISEDIYIPHYKHARRKIISTLLSHVTLGFGTVVAFASYFDREGRCTVQKLSPGSWAYVKSGVWAEGSAVREIHNKAHVIRIRSTRSGLSSIVAERDKDLSS